MNINRRAALVASGAAAMLVLVDRGAAKAGGSRFYPKLMALIDSWKMHDVEGVLSHMTEDVIWQTGGFTPPLRGKAALRAALLAMAPMVKESHWRIFDYAETADQLFVEGVDEFTTPTGARVAIPYAGVIRFIDMQISDWREYYDGRLEASMLAGAALPPGVQSLIDRPAAK
jgi:limonene-1,2-epoxide hydrolase